MRWVKLLQLLCIGVPILCVNGESQTGSVNGDNPNATVHFSNKVDSSYSMSAQTTGSWVFTDDFNWSGPNGWYSPGKYSIACESIKDITTAFVDVSLCFGAQMNGRMYIPGGENGDTIPWSVFAASTVSAQPYIDPTEAIVAVGNVATFRYGYNDVFHTNPGGLWKYSGTDVGGHSVSSGNWVNAGATYNLPTTLKAGEYTITAARNSIGDFSVAASAKVVEVKSVTAGKISSTTATPGDSETLYVERKDNTTVTVTATPEPGSAWPENYPEWSGGGGTVDTSDSAKYIVPCNVAGSYTVTAKCGNSKAIKIVVVDVIIKEGTTVVSDGTTRDKIVGQKISLTATILPADLTVTSQGWTIPGTKIKNYTATTTSTTLTPLPATDLKETSIAYYWVDEAIARSVKFSISIDIGDNKKFEKGATAIYKVTAPSTTMTSKKGKIFIGSTAIECGIPNTNPGIKIKRTTSSSPTGTFEFWQVGISAFTEWTLRSGWKFRGAGSNRLDAYPGPYYSEDSSGVMSDSPLVKFCTTIPPQPGDEYIAVTVNTHFRTWIMFKPVGNNSIYVPLRSLTWYWTGEAKMNSAGSWVKNGTPDISVSISKTTTDFPEWKGTLQKIPIIPIKPSSK